MSDPLEDPTLAREVQVDPTLVYYLTIYTPRFVIDHYREVLGDTKRADELEQLFLGVVERRNERR